jgi:hypothetical protein
VPRNVTQAGMPSKQLLPLPIATPGSLGLNLQQQNSILNPSWAIEASNMVIDANGRAASRGGLTSVTTTPSAGKIRTIFEQRTGTGVSTTIVAWDGGISSSVSAPSTDLVGTISSTASGRWYFVNFMNKVIGFQAGQKPIVRTTGTFSNIVESSGSAPTGGVGTAAYGRVWAMNADGHTLQFSALADETNWGSGDSGSIDLQHVWPLGNDTVTAIQAWNGTLAIFGLKQILFYGSTDPTILGLDVTQLKVVDAIEGVGCISQWTIAPIGGEMESSDLMFCSLIGIQSLQRLLINQSRPITQLTKHVRDALIAMLSSETAANITAVYSPTNGFYALSLPVNGYTWVADMRHRFTDEDGDDVARMTRWPVAPTAMAELSNRTVYMSNVTGKVATYGPGNDYGSNFQVILTLPWMDLGQDYASRLKALKRIGGLFYVRTNTNVTFTWFVNFSTTSTGTAVRATAGATQAEWGIAQWGASEWSGGLLLSLLNADASGEGQYFSLSITAMADSNFAVQQINLLAKLLRLA